MNIKIYEPEKHEPVEFENLMWNDHFIREQDVKEYGISEWDIWMVVPEFKFDHRDFNAIRLNEKDNSIPAFNHFMPNAPVYRVQIINVEIRPEW